MSAVHSAGAAVQAAEAAARTAGVQVREISELDDLEAVYRLYDRIWRPDPKNPPVTTELLRALTKAGNYVGGAFDGAELLGACVGFFSAPPGMAMHSHVAGVSSGALGRSIGFALKLHQRAWAMQRGVSQIAWTFDPLVSRNAYFNLVKLGATAVEYLPNFYGDMNDGINGAGETDRLLVQWDLTAAGVVAASTGTINPADAGAELNRGAVIALARSDDGKPVAGKLAGDTALVAVPHDIEALRRADPDCAQQWRIAVREVLAAVMAAGGHVAGFDKSGWYVVRRHAVQEEESR
ncbi:MAG: GNAT family N-acetyltransferase [Actinobacteria bacterium]|nr:GNAT family N-acetyltransferase [Actinomycetota bacterium]MBO0837243.1 GNAT family N-acetyltransferase [Actinomycetota bacterium]